MSKLTPKAEQFVRDFGPVEHWGLTDPRWFALAELQHGSLRRAFAVPLLFSIIFVISVIAIALLIMH